MAVVTTRASCTGPTTSANLVVLSPEITSRFEAYNPNAALFINWLASYHGGAGALNFADGHSEVHR